MHARLRRLRCPVHGVHVEGVPFARDRARFTGDFENLVAWLATKTDMTATCRLARIDWKTVGRIIARVGEDLLPEERLKDLFEISIDEVAWRKGQKYLTLIGDHRRGRVVWGCDGKGKAAADEFFAELDPPRTDRSQPASRPGSRAATPAPEPGIMVPFGPCPTVAAGEGVVGAWLQAGVEIDPALFARASKLRAVSMDMTGGYAASVRAHAPQATIVIDNYHVVALATKALDEVRREHWNELRQAGQTDHAKQFKDSRWALLKNPDDLTERQATTLAALHAAGGKLPRAWSMKEMVRAIFAPGLTVETVSATDRPAPRAPVPQPPETVHQARTHDPQTPRRDPRRPSPEAQQRTSRSAEQQGQADRPPRLRVPLRRRRARARSPHLRTSHPHTPTRTSVRMTLTYDYARRAENAQYGPVAGADARAPRAAMSATRPTGVRMRGSGFQA